jgi:hypothetical protein
MAAKVQPVGAVAKLAVADLSAAEMAWAMGRLAMHEPEAVMETLRAIERTRAEQARRAAQGKAGGK